MNTSEDGITRRRRRKHSDEFKAKVVSACRKPGVSIAAVALANRLNANLLRRWVVADERAPSAEPIEAGSSVPAPSYLPLGTVKSQIRRALAALRSALDTE